MKILQPGPDSYQDLVEKLDGRVKRPRWAAVKVWLTGWLIRLFERRELDEFDATIYDEPAPEPDPEDVPERLKRVLLVIAITVFLMVVVTTFAEPGQLWGVRIIPENYPA